jgi:hypothetical protein
MAPKKGERRKKNEKQRNKENGNSQTAIKKMNGMRT